MYFRLPSTLGPVFIDQIVVARFGLKSFIFCTAPSENSNHGELEYHRHHKCIAWRYAAPTA